VASTGLLEAKSEKEAARPRKDQDLDESAYRAQQDVPFVPLEGSVAAATAFIKRGRGTPIRPAVWSMHPESVQLFLQLNNAVHVPSPPIMSSCTY
jgi:hypothetical protein